MILNINWPIPKCWSSTSSISKHERVKWSTVTFTVKLNLTSEVILLKVSPAVKVYQMYERADRNSALEGHAKNIQSSLQKNPPKWRVHLFPNLLLLWKSVVNKIFSRNRRNKNLCFQVLAFTLQHRLQKDKFEPSHTLGNRWCCTYLKHLLAGHKGLSWALRSAVH